MLEISKVKLGAPAGFSERCAVRCLKATFGPSSKGRPMITSDWELCGYFDNTNKLQGDIVTKNGVSHKLAGCKCKNVYFTLSSNGVEYYAKFYEAAKGESLTVIDETNPDIAFMEGIVMQALVYGQVDTQKRQLTDEEKAELIAAGKPPVGEPLLDEEGKTFETNSLSISKWVKSYTGELPPF